MDSVYLFLSSPSRCPSTDDGAPALAIPAVLLVLLLVSFVGPSQPAMAAPDIPSTRSPTESRAAWPTEELWEGHFEGLAVADGLPDQRVYALAEDRYGFMWMATQNGLARFDGHDLRVFRHDPSDPSSLPDNYVTALATSEDGSIWVGAFTGELARFDPTTERFEEVELPLDPGCSRMVADFAEIGDGRWAIATYQGLFLLQPDRRQTEHLRIREGSCDVALAALTEDGDDTILFGAGDAVYRWHPGLRSPERLAVRVDEFCGFHEGRLLGLSANRLVLRQAEDDWSERPIAALPPESDLIQSCLVDRRGELWLSARMEVPDMPPLIRVDPATGEVLASYERRSADQASPRARTYLSQFEHSSGVLFFGGVEHGVDRLDPEGRPFERLTPDPSSDSSLPRASILGFADDASGGVFIGTLGAGVWRLDPERGRLEPLGADGGDSPSSDLIWDLHIDRRGWLFMAVETGVEARSPEGRIVAYPAPEGIAGRAVTLFESRDGTLWTGRSHQLLRFDAREERFTNPLEQTSEPEIGSPILAMAETSEGHLFLGLDGGGLARFDPRTGELERFRHQEGNPEGLAHDVVSSLWVEALPEGEQLWIGTLGGGLDRLDLATGIFHHLGPEDGLSSVAVKSLLQDGSGHIWASTDMGLDRIDTETGQISSFDLRDGLLASGFSTTSGYRDRHGRLWFGGTDGLVSFRAENVPDTLPAPDALLTDLEVLHHSVPLSHLDPESPLQSPLHLTEELVLDHEDRVISIGFGALEFSAPERRRFRYRLERFDREWIEATADERAARYSNLPPGSYLLRVQASNDGRTWDGREARLRVRVRPAPWRSPWAHGTYVVIVASLIGAAFRAQRRETERQKAVADELRRLDSMKDQFLTNTSHELRTPLHGILGLADTVSRVEGLPPEVRSDLGLITASGRRMARLVEDILDLSRLQKGEIDLARGPVDLRDSIAAATTIFGRLLRDREVGLRQELADDLPAVLADRGRLEQVLFNLLGNAVKFTHEGEIVIRAYCEQDRGEGDRVIVEIEDTGDGIPDHQLDEVFVPFVQADGALDRSYEGAGLGLSIVRQLLERQGGSIRVKSELGKGSCFVISLEATTDRAFVPPSRAASPAPTLGPGALARSLSGALAPLLREEAGSAEHEPESSDRPRLLAVDDDPINLEILVQFLGQSYEIHQASSGQEALSLFESEAAEIDLAILDIMMPGMDGIELCRRLRARRAATELPVIFLTALDRDQDLVAAIEAGGNDYLRKPVSLPELEVRIGLHLQLLESHRKVHSKLVDRTAAVETLASLLPICSSCKKIRDDEGYWQEVELYVHTHAGLIFSHGLCPVCLDQALETLEEESAAEESAGAGQDPVS